MKYRISVAALYLVLTSVSAAHAGEEYFVLMFGSQRIPNDPDYSHSFATFVRASWQGEGPCPGHPILEESTISWLPNDMKVRLWMLSPECGRNFDLHTTMRWAFAHNMRVSLWGAYRICPELYALAQRQAGLLASGQVRYKALDTGFPSDQVSNCIHACSSIVDGHKLRVASPGWGEIASFAILKRYERYIINSGCVCPWVGSALGLDQYPIIYRDWQSPRSGLFGPAYRLLGGERELRATYGPPLP